jgi:hypothetical protein
VFGKPVRRSRGDRSADIRDGRCPVETSFYVVDDYGCFPRGSFTQEFALLSTGAAATCIGCVGPFDIWLADLAIAERGDPKPPLAN